MLDEVLLILRDLPRRKVALVMLVAVLNLVVVAGLRSRAIGKARGPRGFIFINMGVTWNAARDKAALDAVIETWKESTWRWAPPWDWTSDDWHQAVWTWS
jgi:hypothetical protein